MEPPCPDESDFSEDELFQLRWMQTHGIPPHKLCDKTDPGRIPAAAGKPVRTRAGYSENQVDEEIDLHGDDIQGGLFKVEQLLERARRQKYQRVRIIHGVGADGAEAQSLRLSIRRFLNTRARGWIQGWRYDHLNEGSVVVDFSGNQQGTEIV